MGTVPGGFVRGSKPLCDTLPLAPNVANRPDESRRPAMQAQIIAPIVLGLILFNCFALPIEAIAADGDAKTAADSPTIQVDQIISREDPTFDCAISDLTIGRDGMVYLTSAGHDSGYILRISREGHDKLGGKAVPAINNATADINGQIASSNGHFSHQIAFYDKQFQKIGSTTDFLVSDQVGWDAPADVEAGEGGDFYIGFRFRPALASAFSIFVSVRMLGTVTPRSARFRISTRMPAASASCFCDIPTASRSRTILRAMLASMAGSAG